MTSSVSRFGSIDEMRVAIDAFDPVEGPQQVDERFAGRSAEIAGVDTRQYDFALTLRGDSLRFGQSAIGRLRLAPRASGIVQ